MNPESVNHSERAHAEFGPSSLKYVAGCAGYHGKEGTSDAAEKGTRIHEALEVRDPSALRDEEELELYEQIVEMEKEFMGNFSGIAKEFNEIQVIIQLNGVETWGTCDRFLILKNGNAVMADYKTGISIIDPPEKNWQAKAYVVGAFQQFEEINEITFVFYVPQHRASLAHTFERDRDLQPLIAELSSIIKEGERVRPMWENGTPTISDCRPTQNCRFCRHEENCPALGAICFDIAERVSPEMLPDGDIRSSDVADPAVLEKLFTVAKIVENWAQSIKHKATALALTGHEFEDYKLRSMGSLKKTTEKNYLAQLAVKYGLDMTDVIEASDLSLSRMSSAIRAKTDKGKKTFIVDQFESEAIDLGIVEVGPTRYSLSAK